MQTSKIKEALRDLHISKDSTVKYLSTADDSVAVTIDYRLVVVFTTNKDLTAKEAKQIWTLESITTLADSPEDLTAESFIRSLEMMNEIEFVVVNL